MLAAAVLFPAGLRAQSLTLSQAVQQDTFVSSGQPAQNFGTQGAMEIAAPTASQNRSEETLQGFNTASLQSQFNAAYGAGNWTITRVTVTDYSNVSTAGTQPANGSFNKIAAGGFELDWLSDNNWSETAITWNTLPNILPGTGNNSMDSLGDFIWQADGSSSATWALNLDPNLTSEIYNGGTVTIFGQPTAGSTVGYLFNQQTLAASYLNVTVVQLPEPCPAFLLAGGLMTLGAIRRCQLR